MTRVSLADLPPKYQIQVLSRLAEKPPKKKSKYGNQKVTIDGHTFDSKREAEYYQELKLRKRTGEIVDFELQPEFLLQKGFTKNGKSYRSVKYVADFKVVYPDGRIEVIDVKGHETQVFRLKRKWFEHEYPDLTLTIVK